MKKFEIGIIVFALGFLGLAAFNNGYLLWNHPISYYYTVEGMLVSLKFSTIEAAVVVPLAILGFRYFFGKETKKHL